jgi:hypothetical protein
MSWETVMDSFLPLLLLSLIGMAAFASGYLVGKQRSKTGVSHG